MIVGSGYWHDVKSRIKIKPNKTEEEPVGRLFIPLDVPDKKGSLEEEVISSGVDYRSIEGPKVKKEEEDLYEEQSDEEGGESFDEYVRRRKIEYEKQLSEVSKGYLSPQMYFILTGWARIQVIRSCG